MSDGLKGTAFWKVIEDQLAEARQAKTADDVLRIFSRERNPYGPDHLTDGAGFFAGSGGDGTLEDALFDAGWNIIAWQANYWWAMKAPNGDIISYVEGDLYKGNRLT